MELLNYWPLFLQEILEFQQIANAEQPEFDIAAEDARTAADDFFISSLSEYGIKRWESILGIVADPITESFDFRLGRIFNRLTNNTPYTERTLQKIMDSIVGAGAWDYTIDYNNYILVIESLRPGNNWLREMSLTLDETIPANMLWYLILYQATWRAVRDNHETWGDIVDKNLTWQEVLEGY